MFLIQVNKCESVFQCWLRYFNEMIGSKLISKASVHTNIPPVLSQLAERLENLSKKADKCKPIGPRNNKKVRKLIFVMFVLINSHILLVL